MQKGNIWRLAAWGPIDFVDESCPLFSYPPGSYQANLTTSFGSRREINPHKVARKMLWGKVSQTEEGKRVKPAVGLESSEILIKYRACLGVFVNVLLFMFQSSAAQEHVKAMPFGLF